jgi:hypothetical protein
MNVTRTPCTTCNALGSVKADDTAYDAPHEISADPTNKICPDCGGAGHTYSLPADLISRLEVVERKTQDMPDPGPE